MDDCVGVSGNVVNLRRAKKMYKDIKKSEVDHLISFHKEHRENNVYMRPCAICGGMTDNPDSVCLDCMKDLQESGAL
jgi:uncharacterized OB-fold protein